MRIKLSYRDPDQSMESIKWLVQAERELNHTVRKQLENYAAYGVVSTYIPNTEDKKDEHK